MAGHYPCVRVQIWARLIFVISTYSNGAVQIRVALELAEVSPFETRMVREQSEQNRTKTRQERSGPR